MIQKAIADAVETLMSTPSKERRTFELDAPPKFRLLSFDNQLWEVLDGTKVGTKWVVLCESLGRWPGVDITIMGDEQ
jgi:hypothetical protein